MKMFKVRFAGIPIEFSSRSDFMERFCKDYLWDGKPLFSVSVTEDKINEELQNADEPTTFDYAEALCLYREIAEELSSVAAGFVQSGPGIPNTFT